MTHHIPNPIVLDAALGKCEPKLHHCPRSANCATHLVPAAGRWRGDYTTGVHNWKPESCTGFRDVSKHRPDPEPAAQRVHDTPKGLL